MILTNERIFYTYGYFDPTDLKDRTYIGGVDFFKHGRAIYFGYGQNDRLYVHLDEVNAFIDNGLTNEEIHGLKENFHKRFAIKKILEHGHIPTILKITENMTLREAKDEEMSLIAYHGRADLGLGPLTNMTDGGEGTSGMRHSEETKETISKSVTGRTIITDGKNFKRWATKNIKCIPDGWWVEGHTKNSISITNGKIYKRWFIDRDGEIPYGWYQESSILGYKRITDGTNHKMIKGVEEVPYGWYLGGTLKNMTQITDGKVYKWIGKNKKIPSEWWLEGHSKGKTIISDGKNYKRWVVEKDGEIPDGWRIEGNTKGKRKHINVKTLKTKTLNPEEASHDWMLITEWRKLNE